MQAVFFSTFLLGIRKIVVVSSVNLDYKLRFIHLSVSEIENEKKPASNQHSNIDDLKLLSLFSYENTRNREPINENTISTSEKKTEFNSIESIEVHALHHEMCTKFHELSPQTLNREKMTNGMFPLKNRNHCLIFWFIFFFCILFRFFSDNLFAWKSFVLEFKMVMRFGNTER